MTSFPDTRMSLILQVKDPDNQEAWQEFVGIYRPVIYRTAIKRGLQDADAHDLTQQVLISVAGAVKRWEPTESTTRFRHWLRRIMRNAIINALSRPPRAQPAGGLLVEDQLLAAPAQDSATEDVMLLEYRRELFLRAAQIVRRDVAHETWRAFELTTIEGVSKADAAEQLGKSIGTVYACRSRVLKRLRDVVAELEESQP